MNWFHLDHKPKANQLFQNSVISVTEKQLWFWRHHNSRLVNLTQDLPHLGKAFMNYSHHSWSKQVINHSEKKSSLLPSHSTASTATKLSVLDSHLFKWRLVSSTNFQEISQKRQVSKPTVRSSDQRLTLNIWNNQYSARVWNSLRSTITSCSTYPSWSSQEVL